MSNRPTHKVLQAIRISEDKTLWQELGAAWLNKDQTAITAQLDAIPLSGRVIIKEIASTEE